MIYGNARITAELKLCNTADAVAKYSAAEKIKTVASTNASRFFPRNTHSNAIQPRPLEIFGTKDESRKDNMLPATAPNPAATLHDIVLFHETSTPLDVSTSWSLPVIRM